MQSRYSFLKVPAERRQLALFRSSAAVAIVAGVIGLGYVATHLAPHDAGGPADNFVQATALDAIAGPTYGWTPALAPVDMSAEYAAAQARDRQAATAGPTYGWTPALAPVDMSAEYAAAQARDRQAATDQPTAPDPALQDDTTRTTRFQGEPAVF
jgi:hypothetical protein